MTTVTVSSSPDGALAQRVAAGAHAFIADEPEPTGDDLGPGPYDLLLASLGACTAMTLQMYASRKDWPLHEVTVSLTYAREHIEDCKDGEEITTRHHRIGVSIEVEGPLSDEQRNRLLEIAERCPVHRTLEEEKTIETRLAPAAPRADD